MMTTTQHPTFLTNARIMEIAPAAGSYEPIKKASAKYSFVSTLAVVDALRDINWFPIMVSQSNPRLDQRKGFQQHLIRFTHRQPVTLEQERVDLLLWNSHDLGSAFKLFAGVWRFVCGNGLMIGSELLNFSHKHVGFNMENLLASALKIANHAGNIAKQVHEMKAIEMTPDEQNVYSVSAHKLIYDDINKAPITPDQLLSQRRYDDHKENLWGLYNIVQENLIKGGVQGEKLNEAGERRRVTTRPVKALERNVKLNQALWYLTEKMKELKTSPNN
jgi:Domain of unknown function (DUF932)